MLSDEDRKIAARAVWDYRRNGRFPSDVLCESRGLIPRTSEGAESEECVRLRRDIAEAVGVTPTGYLHLLLTQPEHLARMLLAPLDVTPDDLGWVDGASHG